MVANIALTSPVIISPLPYFLLISSSLSSSSKKNSNQLIGISISRSAPNSLYNSAVYCPPERAYLSILVLMSFGLSVNKIVAVALDDDILCFFP